MEYGLLVRKGIPLYPRLRDREEPQSLHLLHIVHICTTLFSGISETSTPFGLLSILYEV
jgi:hypothetical protein